MEGTKSLEKCSFEIREENEGTSFVLDGLLLDTSKMYHLSIPMFSKIMMKLLQKSTISGYEYCDFGSAEIFKVDKKDQKLFEKVINDCINYRCCDMKKFIKYDMLSQLPMDIAIEESDKLITLGKKHSIYKSFIVGYNIRVEDK